MNVNSQGNDIPPEGIDTPRGRLYRPLADGWQFVILIAAFCGGPALGWVVGRIPGDLSETAQTFLYFPYMIVLFLGNGLWLGRLNAIALDGIGRSILKTLFLLFTRRQAPKSIEDVLPSREKLLEMAVKAQKAAASFASVSWPVGFVAGVMAMLFDSAVSAVGLFAMTAISCIAWGYTLGFLGRRGWLPILEEG